MKLMNGDRVVARLVDPRGYPEVVTEEGTTFMDLPINLFGFDKRRVTYEQFLKWAKQRCCPPERVDIDKVLAEIELEEYDAYEIIKKTKGVLTGIDDFWIDFEFKK